MEKINVVLLLLNRDLFESTLKSLNLDKINLVAVIMDINRAKIFIYWVKIFGHPGGKEARLAELCRHAGALRSRRKGPALAGSRVRQGPQHKNSLQKHIFAERAGQRDSRFRDGRKDPQISSRLRKKT